MKILLTIFCAAMALFGGGCAVLIMPGMFGGGMAFANPLLLIPVGIAVFNVMVIAAVWGWKKPWRPAFYTLAIADFVIALALAFLTMGVASQDPSLVYWGIAATGAFVLKGLMTWLFVRKQNGDAATPANPA